MGFCYLGKGKSGDFPPRRECAPAWRKPLLAALARSELVVAVASDALKYHTGERGSLVEVVNN
jgi:uracil-DNA glycosylase